MHLIGMNFKRIILNGLTALGIATIVSIESLYSVRACSDVKPIKTYTEFDSLVQSPSYKMISIIFFILALCFIGTGTAFIWFVRKNHN